MHRVFGESRVIALLATSCAICDPEHGKARHGRKGPETEMSRGW